MEDLKTIQLRVSKMWPEFDSWRLIERSDNLLEVLITVIDVNDSAAFRFPESANIEGIVISVEKMLTFQESTTHLSNLSKSAFVMKELDEETVWLRIKNAQNLHCRFEMNKARMILAVEELVNEFTAMLDLRVEERERQMDSMERTMERKARFSFISRWEEVVKEFENWRLFGHETEREQSDDDLDFFKQMLRTRTAKLAGGS